MMRVAGEPEAGDLAVNSRAACDCVFEALEVEDARAFGHHEPIPVTVERAAGASGIRVVGRHGTDDRESAEYQRRERRFGTSRERRADVAACDRAKGFADRNRSCRAGVAVREIGSANAELERDLRRCRAAEYR